MEPFQDTVVPAGKAVLPLSTMPGTSEKVSGRSNQELADFGHAMRRRFDRWGATDGIRNNSHRSHGICSVLQASSAGWHGSVGSVAFRDAQPPRTSEPRPYNFSLHCLSCGHLGICHLGPEEDFDRKQNLLRLLFGMPVVLLAEVIPTLHRKFGGVWALPRAVLMLDAARVVGKGCR